MSYEPKRKGLVPNSFIISCKLYFHMVIILITFKSSLPALIPVLIAFIFCIDIKIYCFKVFSLKTKFLKQILEKLCIFC